MKKTAFILAVLAAIAAYSFELTVPAAAEKGYWSGAVEIHAGKNKTGCLTGPGGTTPFTTDGSGVAYIPGLPQGNYYVCVMDWGNQNFTLSCDCEIIVTVPNNADCAC